MLPQLFVQLGKNAIPMVLLPLGLLVVVAHEVAPSKHAVANLDFLDLEIIGDPLVAPRPGEDFFLHLLDARRANGQQVLPPAQR